MCIGEHCEIQADNPSSIFLVSCCNANSEVTGQQKSGLLSFKGRTWSPAAGIQLRPRLGVPASGGCSVSRASRGTPPLAPTAARCGRRDAKPVLPGQWAPARSLIRVSFRCSCPCVFFWLIQAGAPLRVTDPNSWQTARPRRRARAGRAWGWRGGPGPMPARRQDEGTSDSGSRPRVGGARAVSQRVRVHDFHGQRRPRRHCRGLRFRVRRGCGTARGPTKLRIRWIPPNTVAARGPTRLRRSGGAEPDHRDG